MVKFLKFIAFSVIILTTYSFTQVKPEDFSKPEVVNAFAIPDSLKDKSYQYLEEQVFKFAEFSDTANIYVKSYIKKSFLDKDSLATTMGYFLFSGFAEDSLELIYLNQAINFSKTNPTESYPAVIYFAKGDFYFKRANYKEALDNYFISYEISKEQNNNKLAYDSKFNIGSLKNRIGKYEEALEIFREYNEYILSEESEYPKDYYSKLIGLFALSDSYTKLGKLDTASTVNEKGIKISLLNDDEDMYHYFVMNEGVNLFFKKKYENSIDSLEKAIPNLIKLDDQSNIIFSRFYLGRSHFELGRKEEAIFQFKTVDSLYKDFKDLFPELRHGYKILIDHYKKKNDKENQLIYLNRLITVDSILNSNYRYIDNKITKDFDTSNLILDKEMLIDDLSQSNSLKSRSIVFLIVALILVSLFLIFSYAKRKRDKRIFDELINKNNQKDATQASNENKQGLHHLSEDIVEIIKIELHKFETKEEYLSPNISVNNLAKKMNTNSKYLSVFINHYKQVKFTDYINDLRINYAVEKLKSDKKFRKYTIKAIAETVGFSNPVSFSQAFYKKTGIKPSYFIKKLESSSEN